MEAASTWPSDITAIALVPNCALSLSARLAGALKQLAGPVAIEDLDDLCAADFAAGIETRCIVRFDADFREVFSSFLGNVHRLLFIHLKHKFIADAVAAFIDRFDLNCLRGRALLEFGAAIGPARVTGSIAKVDVALGAVDGAFGR